MSNSINIEVDKVCRTCLTPSEDMNSLYETCSSTMKICFAELLSACTPIKCDANDGLSKQLCHNCTDELSRFYIFQLKCVESNGVLQSYLEKQIKIEETNDFEEMLIKTEFDADGSIYFVENSSNSNDVFTNLKSLKNPLDISELQKELEQNLDIIKHEIKHEEIDEIQRDLIPKINRTSQNVHQTSTISSNIDLSTQARIEKPYSCGICNCTFKAKNNLTVHMRKHNRKKPYSCPTCFSSFNRKSYFAVHLRTHTGERPYSCQVCESSFNEKSALTVHMRMHTNERPFPCTVCESSFKQKATLTAHMRKHNGEKPFSCRYCDLSFRQNAHLMTHLRTHTGEKPYWCSVCDRAFKQKISLTRHLRIHTGEKPYSCTNCGRTFTQKKTFQAHLTTHLEAQSG